MARRLLPWHTVVLLLAAAVIAAVRFANPNFGVALGRSELRWLLIIIFLLVALAVALGLRRMLRRP